MNDEELEGTVIPATRGPIRERADGTLTATIVIQPADKGAFLKLLPDVDLPIFIVRQTQAHARSEQMRRAVAQADGKKPSAGRWGQYAKALRLHVDWMGNPDVWETVGSDSQYLEWCRDEPCAAKGCSFKPRWESDRYVRCEAAHVRRVASGAGGSIKPSYSAIPLCRPCHAAQHQAGESAIGGKDWVNKARIRHVHTWAWFRMRVIFGVESMSEADPSAVLAWAQENSLDKFLPRCYVTGVL